MSSWLIVCIVVGSIVGYFAIAIIINAILAATGYDDSRELYSEEPDALTTSLFWPLFVVLFVVLLVLGAPLFGLLYMLTVLPEKLENRKEAKTG